MKFIKDWDNVFISLVMVAMACVLICIVTAGNSSPQQFDLPGFVGKAIDINGTKMSQVRRERLIGGIVQTANEVLTTDREKQMWVILIGVESAFESTSKSRTGAIGLGQLISSYRNDFAAMCQKPPVDEKDLFIDAVNLYLSACYFKHLSAALLDPSLVLVAYNQGMSSKDLKNQKKSASISIEPAQYLARVMRQQELLGAYNK